MPLSPGDSLLNGQYRILRQLGRGGFGFVYQAQDTLLGEEVAVKELIPSLVGDEAMLKRFLAEARATMRLTPVHIVRTHNVFQEGGHYYIVMECLAGGSLEQWLRERGPLPVEEAVRVAAEVLEGLQVAHQQGVVHCDLKPANILFTAGGEAKVGDFGIAHVSEDMLTRTWMTPAGFVAGTLPYMSPEQADGVRDDPRVDLYALGAVLYRMLTGRTYLDFDERETPGAQADNVYRIRSQAPTAPSAGNPAVPAWLDGVVLRALAKQPDLRYTDAAAMRAALLQETVAGPRPATSSPSPRAAESRQVPPPSQLVPAPDRSPPSRRSLPRLFWPLAAAVAAVLVLIVIGIGAIVPPPPPPTPKSSRPPSTPTPTLPPDTATPTLLPSPPTSAPPSPGVGDTLVRDKDGMVMVHVPAGEFLMGSSQAQIEDAVAMCMAAGSTEAECEQGVQDEMPRHPVFLDAYWIDQTEVTNAQYRHCVDAGACEPPAVCDPGHPAFDDLSKADHPVVCVDWSDAQDYCEWAGARLPTEAEWEKAARGTVGLVYPWGESFECSRANLDDETQHDDNLVPGGSDCDGYVMTAPVGSFLTGGSPYGALDMVGNVWEWVADWYGRDYYERSPQPNPQGPVAGEVRSLRGGSWVVSRPNWARSAHRSWLGPEERDRDVGFRCCMAAGQE